MFLIQLLTFFNLIFLYHHILNFVTVTLKKCAETSVDISACLLRYFGSLCMNLTIEAYIGQSEAETKMSIKLHI